MKPKVIIENDVYRKIMYFVNKSNYEVSGLGTVSVEKDGVLRVTSAMLLPQKNGATHTDIEPEDVNRALFALRDSPGELRFWWHSHVNMGVFWSGTDTDTIKKIGEGGWVLSSVFNKKEEVKSSFYSRDGQQTPWGITSLFLDDLETEIGNWDEPNAVAWDKEYDDNVKIAPITPVSTYNHAWNAHEYGGWEYDGGSYKKNKWREAKEELREAKLIPEALPDDDQDDYGFSQAQRTLLAHHGLDDTYLDGMIANGFTPQEILLELEEWENPYVPHGEAQ